MSEKWIQWCPQPTPRVLGVCAPPGPVSPAHLVWKGHSGHRHPGRGRTAVPGWVPLPRLRLQPRGSGGPSWPAVPLGLVLPPRSVLGSSRGRLSLCPRASPSANFSSGPRGRGPVRPPPPPRPRPSARPGPAHFPTVPSPPPQSPGAPARLAPSPAHLTWAGSSPRVDATPIHHSTWGLARLPRTAGKLHVSPP